METPLDEAATLHAEALLRAEESLRRGDFDRVEHAFEEAIAADPRAVEVHHRLGRMLRTSGRHDDAVRVYERCLEHHPGDPTAELGLAALGKRPAPERMPDAIVRGIFESAIHYDDAMAALAYRVPELLNELLDDHEDRIAESPRVLDLGCGTGLAAEFFRPFAARLVGVDLTGPMLEVAREKELYDALHAAELGHYLAHTEESFDLVVAANLWIYFGALDEAFTRVARCLAPEGLFLFDVESIEGDAPRLQPAGRYGHPEAYVREALEASGLRVLESREQTLRDEAERPVPGTLWLATRAPD